MKRFLLLAMTAGVLTAACSSDPASPSEPQQGPSFSTDKVEVCHRTSSGSFNLITVGDPALATHIGHGDGQPGDPVPGVPGKKFAANCSQINAGPDFITFNIRNHNPNGTITAPWDADIVVTENTAGDGFTFSTPQSGQKVGYGTTFFDGKKLNTLETVNWVALQPLDNGKIPYLNIWVTDGIPGHYAVIASEFPPYQGTDFLTRQGWKVFEFAAGSGEPSTGNLNWLFPSGTTTKVGAFLLLNGVNVTLAQFGDNIVIRSPTDFTQAGIGTGAPRGGFGLNLIWGDTQANFSGEPQSQIGNLTVRMAGTTYSASN